jgi:hypothetical protein
MDMQKEMENIKKIMDEVLQVTKISLSDPTKVENMKMDEIDNVMVKVQSLIEKLNSQSDQLLQEMGLTKEQMLQYADDPKNFSKEQWEIIQYMKKEAEKFQSTLQDAAPDHAKEQLKRAEMKLQPKKKKPPKNNWMQS